MVDAPLPPCTSGLIRCHVPHPATSSCAARQSGDRFCVARTRWAALYVATTHFNSVKFGFGWANEVVLDMPLQLLAVVYGNVARAPLLPPALAMVVAVWLQRGPRCE